MRKFTMSVVAVFALAMTAQAQVCNGANFGVHGGFRGAGFGSNVGFGFNSFSAFQQPLILPNAGLSSGLLLQQQAFVNPFLVQPAFAVNGGFGSFNLGIGLNRNRFAFAGNRGAVKQRTVTRVR